MGSLTIWHWIIVALVILLLIGGRGRLSQLMSEFFVDIESFKKGVRQDDARASPPPQDVLLWTGLILVMVLLIVFLVSRL